MKPKTNGVTVTPTDSVQLALENGCDLNCGNMYAYIMQAYEEGKITEEMIRTSCTRLLTTRMKLGMFDQKTPFDAIGMEVVDCEAHRAVNEEMTRASMVLLKNNGILPLDKKKIRTIAVIGPNANSINALEGNYHGTANQYITVLEGIRAEFAEARIHYCEGSHLYEYKLEDPVMEKPDYVMNFVRPANTEIKYIRGHWYLYERSNVYDPQLGRSRKKSGKILGSITEQGLVPSRARRGCVNPVLNDVVEVGAVNYIYQRSEWMRSRLQKHFPDLWEAIYVTAVVRAIYDCRFRRLQLHYEDSILSYLYPGLSFMPNAVTEFLNTLGRMRGAIRGYMQEMVAEHERFLLFDGHRLLSASRTIDNAECGYDSKMRYKPQINLLYLFTMGGDIGYPVYYKQYLGSTLDVSAFSDILKESTAHTDIKRLWLH